MEWEGAGLPEAPTAPDTLQEAGLTLPFLSDLLLRTIYVRGAMIGVELSVDGTAIVSRCLQRRLLVNCTHGTVLRLLPALTLTDGELDEGCAILEDILLSLA